MTCAAGTVELRPGYTISRLIKGGWQLAGGHGEIDAEAAIADMASYAEAGLFTFDCADIYTGVEALIGTFRRRAPEAVCARLKVHTKFVPDLGALPRIDRAHVRRIIERSLQRLGQERLDLVQFHWWDYAIPRYRETALWLCELQAEGKVAQIGGTNFDAVRAAELLDAGVDLCTMQVQYSVLDDRPASGLAALCARSGMRLLCYGTVAGGFIGERWLGAAPPSEPLENRSLVKYKLVIDDAGGWEWFQALLRALAAVGRRHGAGIGAVATRYVLDQPHAAAAIVGARNRAHLDEHAKVFGLALDDADRAALGAVLAQRSALPGDVYALERDRSGRHGRIMKYSLGDV
ncbi:MAG: aldo/keto reductase [Acetobacteraceae bacterium]|nr:aldo/keto reductase [Acetobacteraceae bacterium]